jgi:hypothetical protein
MSTRSRIAVLQPDGKVKSVYCHFDGYTDHVGRLLFENYNTEEKANELVALGGISVLAVNLYPLAEAPESHFSGLGKPRTILAEEHSYDNAQDGVTIAYHRDRKEDFTQAISENLETFNAGKNFQEYNYLFMDSKWFIRDEKKQWVELTADIVENDLPETE